MGFAQPVCAQTNARPGVKRLAIFHPTDPPEGMTSNAHRAYKAYFDELKKLGYIEGQNLIVDRYSGLGLGLPSYGDLVRQIVASHPDVILPISGTFIKEIMALTTDIPMVAPTSDPITYGFTTSLARPDRNFTGVVMDAGLEIWAKRVQLLLETARKVTKVGFFGANPTVVVPTPGTHSAYCTRSRTANWYCGSLCPSRWKV
jgi:putative ABC transport system substrate-binding protein